MTRPHPDTECRAGAGVQLDDPVQLERFRDGDPGVLAAVYRAHVQRVARFLRAGFSIRTESGLTRFPGLRTECDLEIGVHEVFARAFSSAARRRYDGVRPFEGYLMGIARNYCIDLGRMWRIESRRRLAAEQEAELTPSHVELDLELSDAVAVLAEFVAALEPEERQIYHLCIERGEAQERVAATLGRNRMQVRRVAERLRRLLRARLEEAGCTHRGATVRGETLGRR